jgi:CRISP-associated protein Cas1
MFESAAAEPPIRVMALHALLYCERLFYLEEVEEIRVADAAVYAGRELHAGLDAAEGQSVEAIELSSQALGLHGRVDTVKRRDGDRVPYEHKRGRCRRGDDGVALAWASDRIQAAAYGMMLEEALGRPVAEARVRYHADNSTVRIPLDDAVRNEVRGAVERARVLRRTIERPPVTNNENLCRRCSLAPVCLPEEVRQDEDPTYEPRRLFPPDDQRGALHIVSHGAAVGRSGDRLVVHVRDAPDTSHPSREIGAVILHGFTQISTQAIRLCREADIAVHWVTASGGHTASLTFSAGQTQRRVRQYRALAESATCLRLARQLVRAKIEGQHRYLLRATRSKVDARSPILRHLRAIARHLTLLDRATDTDALRGHEGDAAVHYFGSINSLLSPSVPDELRYAGRTRRPPVDRFSAILSYGYGLLATAVTRAVLAVGLEPALGFFHTPRSAAHPLVLDLMDIFRVPVWDVVVIGSLNRGQWDPDRDFVVTKSKVWLSDEGRRKAIGLFEARLQAQWKHPVVGYSLSYARTLELEARLLEKEWSGEPGLFGRLRLR